MTEIVGNGFVKRLSFPCCGMGNGRVYEAVISPSHALVKLPDGSWTSPHAIEPGFFEVCEGPARPPAPVISDRSDVKG